MRSRALSSAAATALAVLLLTACSGSPEPTTGGTDSSPTIAPPSPSATPSPSPSASETAVALDCPAWTDDPDAAVAAIGVNRFAGACLGQTFDEATANGTATVGDEMCPWYATVVADDDMGYYVNIVKHGDGADGTIYLFMVKWFSDPLEAKNFDLPMTAEGIGIGSTAEETLAAYPTATEVSFDDISRGPRHQIVVPTGDTTSYNFDITEGLVSEISWGEEIGEGGPNGELCAL